MTTWLLYKMSSYQKVICGNSKGTLWLGLDIINDIIGKYGTVNIRFKEIKRPIWKKRDFKKKNYWDFFITLEKL